MEKTTVIKTEKRGFWFFRFIAKLVFLVVIIFATCYGYCFVNQKYFAPKDADAGKSKGNISVVGKCIKQIATDKVKINFSIENTNADSKIAVNKSQTTFNDFTEKLKGNSALEINTNNYYVSQVQQYDSKTQTYIDKGFKSVISFEVSSSNADEIAKVVDIAKGYNNLLVKGMQNYVSTSKMDTEKSSCLDAAIKDAKVKAKSIANSLGVVLGEPTSFSTVENNAGRVYQAKSFMAGLASDEVNTSPDMFQNTQELSVDVNINFLTK